MSELNSGSPSISPEKPNLGVFALVVGLVLLAITVSGWQLSVDSEATRVETITSREASKLASLQQLFTAEFNAYLGINRLVVEELAEDLSTDWIDNPEVKVALALQLDRLMRLAPAIDQARVLTTQGFEVVRLNRQGKDIVTVPTEQLQDKSSRDYVIEARTRPVGKATVSRMSLNKEYGQLDPRQLPVIRFTTQFRSASADTEALFVFNYDSTGLLARYKAAAHSPPTSELYLINPSGEFLIGGERYKDLEFASDRGLTDATIGALNPGLWAALLSSEGGQYRDTTGLYLFRSLEPPAKLPNIRVPADSGKTAYVVIFIPASSLNATSVVQNPIFLSFIALLYTSLLGGATLYWRQLQATDAIAQSDALIGRQSTTLYRERQRLAVAAQAGNIGLSEFNTGTGEFECNQQFRDIYELPEETYPVVRIEQVLALAPENERAARRGMLYSMTKPITVEARIILADGRSKWLRRSFKPFNNERGERVVIGSVIDISENKAREEALLTANQRFELARQFSGIGVIRGNLDTGIWECDANARKLYDLPIEEYPRVTTQDFESRYLSPQDADGAQHFLTTLSESGQSQSIIRHKVWRDGSSHYVQLVGEVYQSEDSQLYFLGILFDVTDQIEQQMNLARVNEQQRKMFSIISHELRTPAAAIEMLGHELDINPSDKAELLSVTGHLISVIDDLRITVNPETEIRLELAAFKVRDFIGDVERQVSGLVSSANISIQVITTSLDDRCDVLITDVYRLRTIATNLIRNSVAHSAGSKIRLTVASRVLSDTQAELTLSVEDNGIGVPENKVAQMFQPFERGDTASSGTGVGLYIVSSWAEKLGGSVSYSTSSLGGACFSVSLEVEIGSEVVTSVVSASRVAEAEALLKDKRVLLVEDDRILRKASGALLSKEFNLDLRLTADGKEALLLLESEPADLVITDYFMPNLDGRELIQQRLQNGGNEVFIGLTAAAIGDEGSELLKAGASAVLIKPLRAEALAAEVIRLAEAGIL